MIMQATVSARPLAEFDSYRENELEDLMLKSKCFFLIQNYHTAQLKLQNLKAALTKTNFRLQKVPAVSFNKTQSVFFQHAGWVPVATNNWVVYSTSEVIWADLKKVVSIFQEHEIAILFCQNLIHNGSQHELAVVDINRFTNFQQYFSKSFSISNFLLPHAFFLARLALLEKLFLLLKNKKNEF